MKRSRPNISRSLFPEACRICCADFTPTEPGLALACSCRAHHSCLEAQLAAGFVTPYVTDTHLRCCTCRKRLEHPQLRASLLPFLKILHIAEKLRSAMAQELGLHETPNWRVTWCATHRQAQLVEQTVGCVDEPPPCRKCIRPHCPHCDGCIEHDGGCTRVRHCARGAHACGWEGWDSGSLWEHEVTGVICTQDDMTEAGGYHLHTYRPMPCDHGGLCGQAWDVQTGMRHCPYKPLTACTCDRCHHLKGVHFDGRRVGHTTYDAWVRSFAAEDAAAPPATDGME